MRWISCLKSPRPYKARMQVGVRNEPQHDPRDKTKTVGATQEPQPTKWRVERTMRDRRANVTGRTYSFTANLAERGQHLLVDHVDILRASEQAVKRHHPFHIDAFLVMPDHLHTV